VGEIRRVEKLRRDHPVEGFDCGRKELNRYLWRYAWQNQHAGAAQTYVGIAGEVVVGYHCLGVGQVILEDAPDRLKQVWQSIPYPLSVMLPEDVQFVEEPEAEEADADSDNGM
jgi:hypothetical protein